MITPENIKKILEKYDKSNLTINTLGGHSALDVCRGAKLNGFRTLVVCQKGREKTYAKYYKARETLEDEVNAVLGYGVQGRAQALNMLENGFKVVVGVQERYSKPGEKQTGWEKALEDK